MKRSYLIADSGSSKTSWLRIDETGQRLAFEGRGINPVRDSEETIRASLPECLLADDGHSPAVVCFYGAGCLPPYSHVLKHILHDCFPRATEVRVESDLLGAAHALLGRQAGIACILGTGSNSCLYDGERIVDNVSPLGYILGDEGSGAVLGRRLLGDVWKGKMGEQLRQQFLDETELTPSLVVQRVYREPEANRFLASLVPFLHRHRTESAIHDLLIDEFRRFFCRNVAHYSRPDLPVSFVGGVAHSFHDELTEAARLEGFIVGTVVQRPIEGIVQHLSPLFS